MGWPQLVLRVPARPARARMRCRLRACRACVPPACCPPGARRWQPAAQSRGPRRGHRVGVLAPQGGCRAGGQRGLQYVDVAGAVRQLHAGGSRAAGGLAAGGSSVAASGAALLCARRREGAGSASPLSAGARDACALLALQAAAAHVHASHALDPPLPRAPRQVFSGHTGPVVAGSFTPDGKAILSAGGEGDASLRVWNPKTGECTLTVQVRPGPPMHEQPSTGTACSPIRPPPVPVPHDRRCAPSVCRRGVAALGPLAPPHPAHVCCCRATPSTPTP